MGVRQCNKCDNIMCNTYIQDVGYLCDKCLDEKSKKELKDTDKVVIIKLDK